MNRKKEENSAFGSEIWQNLETKLAGPHGDKRLHSTQGYEPNWTTLALYWFAGACEETTVSLFGKATQKYPKKVREDEDDVVEK